MLPLRVRVAVLVLVVSVAQLAKAQNYSEGGYANKHSVVAGDTISFHIATSRSPFDVEIINMASQTTVLQTISGLLSQTRNCSGLWENGCGWPVTTTFTVPANYVPGYYAARFPTSAGTKYILFVVRPAVPGSYAPIALIQPSNSDTAYNRFGGKSVYDPISDDGHRAYIVSFNRPYNDDSGLARFQIWESKFVQWMKSEGRKFEVITDDDMEAGIDLSAYKAVLIVGHSEYWSLNARQRLEAYSRSGGHIGVFGGNTMWWQVRVNLQTRQMTVYKDASLDPLKTTNPDLVTVNYWDWPVLHPENSILGASFLNASYANRTANFDRVPLADRVPYTVRKADHWSLAGTGLSNGATFGRSVGAIELDGALFNTLPNGDVVVEGSDGTPLSYEVLATLPSSDGYATIGFYANAQGGGVFNGAARDWAYGLVDDPVIQRITRNVLDRFVTGQPFPYAPRRTPNRAEDRFNTPHANPDYLPGWRFSRFGFNINSGCAHEGQSGVQLAGPKWTQVFRNLDVGRAGATRGAMNFWVNADALQSTPYPTSLVGFINYAGGGNIPTIAAVEIEKRAAGPSLRVSSFAGTAYAASTNWLTLTPGWHSVQFSWSSNGLLELNVSGKKTSTTNSATGAMNAVLLEFAGSVISGTVCIDQLQMRDVFAPASPATSTITATPSAIAANGTSTATVLVRLFDANGDPIENGGDAVTLSTTLGSLSAVSDVGDGTYTATLTSGTTGGTATISATVNNQPLAATATVQIQSSQSATTTTLASSSPTSIEGSEVTFTATITSSGSGTITGTVTFREGTTVLGSGPVAGGIATFKTSTLAQGTHSITAEYGGNTSFQGSTSAPLQQKVDPRPPTKFTLTGPNTAIAGSSVTLVLTAADAAGNPVPSYRGTVHFTGAAITDYTFTASDAGRHQFSAIAPSSAGPWTVTVTDSTLTANVTIAVQGQTSTALTSSSPSSFAGDEVTFTATVTSSATGTINGTVTFKDGTTVLGTGTVTNGVATLKTSALAQGTHSITAEYGGNTNFLPSTSAALQQRVDPRPPAKFMLTAPSTVLANAPVTLVLTAADAAGNPVASYRGTVHFTSAAIPDYTFTAADAGRHQFTATAPSNVGPWTITVADSAESELSTTVTIAVQGQTSTALTSSSPSSFAGDEVTFTATVTSAATGTIAGTVTFRDGTTAIGSAQLTNGVATFKTTALAEGMHSITAGYAGSGDFQPSTSSAIQQNVDPKIALSLTGPGAADAGDAVILVVTATDTAGNLATAYRGTVHFTSANGTIPQDYTFTAADNGRHEFNVTAPTATGPWNVTVEDVADSDLADTITIDVQNQPSVATKITLTAPAVATAGKTITVSLLATDANGGAASTYRGTVHFTSTSGTMPSDYTFIAAEGGRHDFSLVVPARVGAWTITVTDTADSTLTSSATIDVQGETTTSLTTPSPNSKAGDEVTFTATVTSNAAGTITGNVTFRDGATTLGSVAVSGGVATFKTSALSSGNHAITAEYSGGGGFLKSTSSALQHTVTPLAPPPPASLIATGTGPNAITLSWTPSPNATRYEVWRRGSSASYVLVTSTTSTSLLDNTINTGRAYTYYVRAVGPGGTSGNSPADNATTVVFSDDALQAGVTTIKADHVMELRTAINALRATAGIPQFSFTDSTLAGKPFRALHVTELRDALIEARAAAGLPPWNWSSPAPTIGDVFRAVHLQDLRDALK